MTSLLQAAAADVREAASYAPKEAMPMTNEEAIQVLVTIRAAIIVGATGKEALDIAIAALRAQPEPGPQRDYEAEIAILTAQRDDIEMSKCKWVRKARDFEYRADRLERIADVLLDRIEHGS